MIARALGPLIVETPLEGTNLLLEAVHAGLQLEQLGAQSHLVELLLNPVQALLDPFQPGDQHVVLDLQVLDLVSQGVEQGMHLVAEAPLRTLNCSPNNPLDVRDHDLPVELREDLDQIFHDPDVTPGPVARGPNSSHDRDGKKHLPWFRG